MRIVFSLQDDSLPKKNKKKDSLLLNDDDNGDEDPICRRIYGSKEFMKKLLGENITLKKKSVSLIIYPIVR